MARSLLSWLIVGITTYAWLFIGYTWPPLKEFPWQIWTVFTIIVLVMHVSIGNQVGADLLKTLINRFRIVIKNIVGLIIAVEVGAVAAFFIRGLNVFLSSLMLVIFCAIITTILVAAIEDASQQK